MTGPEETVVPATPELVRAYLGSDPAHSFRGWVGLRDGEPIGVAGVYREGGALVAFSQYRDDPPPSRRTRARVIRLVVGMMSSLGRPVFAICNPQLATAPALLTKLGFQPTGVSCERGDILVRYP